MVSLEQNYRWVLFIGIALLVNLVSGWSPTNGYAPGKVDCPSKSLSRKADSLSKEEADWLNERNKKTNENLITFLKNAKMKDFDAENFISNTSKPITIGIAFSGGGYRAMLSGAGQLAALDNRTKGATKYGLGGLLQASTYLAGLSGGNWLVGSFAFNNFTSIEDILNQRKIWDLEHSIINYGGWNVVDKYKYYELISDDLSDKKKAGFEISLTDTWGRALSHQFFSTLDDAGAGLTFSSLRDFDGFANHEMPFPVVVTDGRTPGTQIISGNSTVFEVNPFELGSWDPSVYEFTDVKYLGSAVKDDKTQNLTCYSGFDNAGFVLGTSSTLFNQFILQINTTSISGALKDIIEHFLSHVSKKDDDIAVYKPNPFYQSANAASESIKSNESLFLVDGGEDLQNVPLYPLLQPERKVDVIFAYDNSADTNQSWPNGASLVATYERQFLDQGNGTAFPYVPDVNTFRNLNLTAKPTFFGCDAKNMSSLIKKTNTSSVYDIPLVVYTANRPFTYWSNTSTFKLSYEDKEKRDMVQNGFEVGSRLNSSLDKDWPACVGCAIIRREQERKGIEQSDQCKECFKTYCWNGDLDSEDKPGINFTTTGTTNGPEKNGNKTINAAVSILLSDNRYSLFKSIGYGLLVTLIFTTQF